MASLADDFVEFLIGVCEDDGSTTYVDGILADARAAISGGKGTVSSLVASGLNGKSFNRAVHLSAIEVARACQVALATYAGTETEVSSTYADYRGMNR